MKWGMILFCNQIQLGFESNAPAMCGDRSSHNFSDKETNGNRELLLLQRDNNRPKNRNNIID